MVKTVRYEGDEWVSDHIPIVVTADAVDIIGNFFVLCVRAHFTKVPQAKRLVLPVGNHVATVAFGRHIGYAFCVANQHTRGLLRRAQRATVPMFIV